MEIVRTRDVVVLKSDKTLPVKISSSLAQNGWPGGQGVQWAPSTSDEFKVDFSDGYQAAFLLWGSDETSDQFISYVGSQPKYEYAVACFGTWVISTSTFEKYTLQSRLIPPLVENTFVPGEHVYFSLRGFFTPQDEWTIDGDPRAPNENYVGTVIQAPSSINNNYLMLQTIL